MTLDRDDAAVLVILAGAAVMLAGAYLLSPPFAILLFGAFLIWIGRRS